MLTVTVPSGHVMSSLFSMTSPFRPLLLPQVIKTCFLFSLSQLTTLYITLSMILSDFEVC